MHNAGACSIHDLPDELLSHIFQECLDLQDVDLTCDHPRISYRVLVILCSINHRMRILATNSPRLWAYFQLSAYPDYPPIPFIELCIKRFGTTAPIYLDFFGPNSVNTGHPGEAVDEEHAIDTIALLCPHLHRWKSFKIFFEDRSAEAFVKLPLENARTLERIEIASPCGQKLNHAMLANIVKLPVLHYLTWDEYHVSDNTHIESSFGPIVSDFPWRHLRMLVLNVTLLPDVALQMFSSLESVELVSVNLRQLPFSHVGLAPPTLIRLPKLQELYIMTDLGIYEIVHHLNLPGIKNLQVRVGRYMWDGPIPPFAGYKDFVVRASASLVKGHFDAFGFHGGDIVGLLGHPELLRIPNVMFGISSGLETAERALKSAMNTRLDLKPSENSRISE